jgi:YfiH family protein
LSYQISSFMTSLDLLRLLRPAIFSAYSNLIAAQSTRNGGLGKPPYDSLNLGLHTQDDPAIVEENRQLFFNDLSFDPTQIAGMHQVHGTATLIVKSAGQYEGFDALITAEKDILLTITVADCTPILIFDPQTEPVAAIHASWRGTVNEIVVKTLAEMHHHFEVKASNCLAYIGPCIDRNTFEVDADVANHFPNEFKDWDPIRQKYLVDLKKANQFQLESIGLLPENIEVSPYSTVAYNNYFCSHRKERGQTGRMLCAIGMKA